MIDTERLERRAIELRAAFDRSFALPPPQETEVVDDLLAVRVRGDLYAIRLRDISGVVARRTIVAVPAGAAGLLGVAGIRGDLVPVFSLSSFLGYVDDHEAPIWTVLCGGEHPIGLGFAELEGYLRLPKSAVHKDESSHVSSTYLTDVAVTETGGRPVIAVSHIITDIRNRRGPQRPGRE